MKRPPYSPQPRLIRTIISGLVGALIAVWSIWLMLVLVLALPADAGTPLDPPARFDRPFHGALIIRKIDRANVWKECNAGQTMRRDVAGCAFLDGDTCTVYLAVKTRRAPLDAILRHEIAHCNGWTWEHEQ